MDGVNEPDENSKISNLLDPGAEKQTFGRKTQNWPNFRDENGILLGIIKKIRQIIIFLALDVPVHSSSTICVWNLYGKDLLSFMIFHTVASC
ncbi:hypothetical protein Hanom_Chr06g00487651 [Helianthus anomalus]